MDGVWECEIGGWAIDAALLLGCTYSLLMQKTKAKPATDDKDSDDDFGRSQMHYSWYKSGRNHTPPAYLHWCLVYAATALLWFVVALTNVGFSLFALRTWVWKHPTGSIAIFVNLLRGIGLLPQLHMSRRAGWVSPSLASWIAMIGVVDIVELLADGIAFSDLCYIIGDLISFVVVSDFMWIFIKSRFKGKAVVEIPSEYEV
jgi:hypothetical protein